MGNSGGNPPCSEDDTGGRKWGDAQGESRIAEEPSEPGGAYWGEVGIG